jgi:hypothetical protein
MLSAGITKKVEECLSMAKTMVQLHLPAPITRRKQRNAQALAA